MTKKQKADALLAYAAKWQMGVPAKGAAFLDDEAPALWDDFGQVADGGWYGLCASAALSEVCHGLGFEIETVES